jgi:hypothetical protein
MQTCQCRRGLRGTCRATSRSDGAMHATR